MYNFRVNAQSDNVKKKLLNVSTTKKISHICSYNDFFCKALHKFEVENPISNLKRIEASVIFMFFSVMPWPSTYSSVSLLGLKYLGLAREILDVFCWHLYQMNPQSFCRKKLGGKITDIWQPCRRYGKWIGLCQEWLDVFIVSFYFSKCQVTM